MEDKRYPVFEEEDTIGKVNEPIGAVAYPVVDQETEPEDRLPISSPSTWEEAMSDLDSSESDILSGHGTTWDVVKQMMADRIKEYAR